MAKDQKKNRATMAKDQKKNRRDQSPSASQPKKKKPKKEANVSCQQHEPAPAPTDANSGGSWLEMEWENIVEAASKETAKGDNVAHAAIEEITSLRAKIAQRAALTKENKESAKGPHNQSSSGSDKEPGSGPEDNKTSDDNQSEEKRSYESNVGASASNISGSGDGVENSEAAEAVKLLLFQLKDEVVISKKFIDDLTKKPHDEYRVKVREVADDEKAGLAKIIADQLDTGKFAKLFIAIFDEQKQDTLCANTKIYKDWKKENENWCGIGPEFLADRENLVDELKNSYSAIKREGYNTSFVDVVDADGTDLVDFRPKPNDKAFAIVVAGETGAGKTQFGISLIDRLRTPNNKTYENAVYKKLDTDWVFNYEKRGELQNRTPLQKLLSTWLYEFRTAHSADETAINKILDLLDSERRVIGKKIFCDLFKEYKGMSGELSSLLIIIDEAGKFPKFVRALISAVEAVSTWEPFCKFKPKNTALHVGLVLVGTGTDHITSPNDFDNASQADHQTSLRTIATDPSKFKLLFVRRVTHLVDVITGKTLMDAFGMNRVGHGKEQSMDAILSSTTNSGQKRNLLNKLIGNAERDLSEDAEAWDAIAEVIKRGTRVKVMSGNMRLLMDGIVPLLACRYVSNEPVENIFDHQLNTSLKLDQKSSNRMYHIANNMMAIQENRELTNWAIGQFVNLNGMSGLLPAIRKVLLYDAFKYMVHCAAQSVLSLPSDQSLGASAKVLTDIKDATSLSPEQTETIFALGLSTQKPELTSAAMKYIVCNGRVEPVAPSLGVAFERVAASHLHRYYEALGKDVQRITLPKQYPPHSSEGLLDSLICSLTTSPLDILETVREGEDLKSLVKKLKKSKDEQDKKKVMKKAHNKFCSKVVFLAKSLLAFRDCIFKQYPNGVAPSMNDVCSKIIECVAKTSKRVLCNNVTLNVSDISNLKVEVGKCIEDHGLSSTGATESDENSASTATTETGPDINSDKRCVTFVISQPDENNAAGPDCIVLHKIFDSKSTKGDSPPSDEGDVTGTSSGDHDSVGENKSRMDLRQDKNYADPGQIKVVEATNSLFLNYRDFFKDLLCYILDVPDANVRRIVQTSTSAKKLYGKSVVSNFKKKDDAIVVLPREAVEPTMTVAEITWGIPQLKEEV